MRNTTKTIRRCLLLIPALMAWGFGLSPTVGSGMDVASSPTPRVVVKFVEGLEVRLSDGRISGHPSSQSGVVSDLEKRSLTPSVIEESFESLREVLSRPEVVSIQPQFSHEAHGLQPEGPKEGETNLQLYYSIALHHTSPQKIQAVISDLTALPIVEAAYQAPIPKDTEMGLPTD
jgi:hypothetical protein